MWMIHPLTPVSGGSKLSRVLFHSSSTTSTCVLRNKPKCFRLLRNKQRSFLFPYGAGGHINPAVTLAMCVFGRCDWHKLPAYFIGQCLGGFLGSLVIYSAYYDLISHYQTDIAGLTINETWSIKTAGIFATMPNDHVGLVGCYYDQ
uniref:Uncharacterized protein n=1 Tax=Romanomermis culicivorax TaxID=13658 RepID=A0A915HK28_ROMCU